MAGIYSNSKRKHLHETRIQLPKDFLGTRTSPPLHCFWTPIWPPWRHVKMLYSFRNSKIIVQRPLVRSVEVPLNWDDDEEVEYKNKNCFFTDEGLEVTTLWRVCRLKYFKSNFHCWTSRKLLTERNRAHIWSCSKRLKCIQHVDKKKIMKRESLA